MQALAYKCNFVAYGLIILLNGRLMTVSMLSEETIMARKNWDKVARSEYENMEPEWQDDWADLYRKRMKH